MTNDYKKQLLWLVTVVALLSGAVKVSAKHAMVVLADLHLHGMRNDLATFRRYAATVRQHADSLQRLGYEVSTLCLGDVGDSQYWGSTGVDLLRTREYLDSLGLPRPLRTVIGNHDYAMVKVDNDSTASVAARSYEQVYGPRYYSFDIEGAHYVVLDNIRGRATVFPAEELDWLERDLARVPKGAPLFVAMHAPVHSYIKGGRKVKVNGDAASSARLLGLLKPFERAVLLSGHTHRNGLVRVQNGANELVDLNLVSSCGSIWWNTGYGDPNLGHDGNPVGFEIIEVDGSDVSWRFIPYEQPALRRFKVWSGNELKRSFAANRDVDEMLAHLPKWGRYEQLPPNALLVQVWDWDPKGELTVIEEDASAAKSATTGGRAIEVKEVYEVHPDYYATTAVQKTVWMHDYKKAMQEPRRARMLMAVASRPDARLLVRWTDPYGRVAEQHVALTP